MFWFFYNYYPKYPYQKRVWFKVRFIHETNKAILVYYNNRKAWIPKSRVYKIRLKKGVFEICVRENLINS